MQMEWATIVGLVGCTLVISGSNVLPQFREWCEGFKNPWQPLRWIGLMLEFAGIVTDKSMATGFLIGVLWWSRALPWSDVLLLSGQLTVAAALADGVLALMHAVLRRVVGSGGPMAPMRIPRNRIDELEESGLTPPRATRPVRRKPPTGAPLTEEQAFDSLDDDEAEQGA